MDAATEIERWNWDIGTPPPALESRRILVVEDDDAVRRSVASVLQDEGYTVASAANGAEALASILKARPSLIVLDLMMPVMNGHELLETMREAGALESIPVVVITAAQYAGTVEKISVFIKPFDLDDFVKAIRSHVA